jgi:two-component system, NtrC family, nitrogen regulation sensor histidine kinase NtrY
MLRRLAFRSRLLLILSLFALVPAIALTVAWSVVVGKALPLVPESAAWERAATSASRAGDSLRAATLSPGQRAALREHQQELEQSVIKARQFSFIADRVVRVVIVSAVVLLIVLAVVASRVAGHLSRQMSRPLNELVGWAEFIARGEALPTETPLRGAPEFKVLRERMRKMSSELAAGRVRALESERLRAFRESARRFAHELKNPLTPIQFALARLERDAPRELGDALQVLRTETQRLDQMSRSFAQFGRLPEGVLSDVDVGELVRYTTRAVVPPDIPVEIDVATDPPMIRGHHDALQRALSNVLLNAVDACGSNGENGKGKIGVVVERMPWNGGEAVAIRVRDEGCGIPAERIENIWEPYVTSKPGGTGLGLAIARQTILAHHGSVAAESVPGRGTEIRMILPVNTAHTS